jgi:hypothetical protein
LAATLLWVHRILAELPQPATPFEPLLYPGPSLVPLIWDHNQESIDVNVVGIAALYQGRVLPSVASMNWPEYLSREAASNYRCQLSTKHENIITHKTDDLLNARVNIGERWVLEAKELGAVATHIGVKEAVPPSASSTARVIKIHTQGTLQKRQYLGARHGLL